MSSPRASFRCWVPHLLFICVAFAISSSAATFAPGQAIGTVQTFSISEASGIVASRQNPGVLYTHNDSSSPGVVFALSTNATLLGYYNVPPTGGFGDFEDIAIGPGPSPEYQYIYLGDIGDNYSLRPYIRVFRFPEPAIYQYQSAAPPPYNYVAGATEIDLTYPDGPANAEALLVDPLTGDLFIATKLLTSSRIYRASRAQLEAGGTIQMTFLREISFFKVSGGDISPDGRLIALRRGNKISIWTRGAAQSVSDALGGIGVYSPAIGDPTEPNGEAVGFQATGLGYYTISEGFSQPIYYFRRTDAEIPRQPVVLISPGQAWRYHDAGTDQGTSWQQLKFDDSAWSAGPAPLGYGQSDEQTTVAFGANPSSKNTTTYFRKTFTVPTTLPLDNLTLRLCFTDGIAIYINGLEAFRTNLAPGATFDQLASGSNSDRQNIWSSFTLNPALLLAGTNVIAVESHRMASDGPDLTFDLQLIQGALEFDPRKNSTDSKRPVVVVTAPLPNSVVTNTLLTVRGTAGDNVGVARVGWKIGNSEEQTAGGSNVWSAQVPLEVGTNVISVTAYDRRTNASLPVARTVVRLALSPLTLFASGMGTVTPNLNGATLIVTKPYVLTATPAPRHLFAGWTGDIVTNSPRLNFLMQSNLMVQANFVTNPFIATKGSYRGLFQDTNNLSHDSSGALTVSVTENGTFSAGLRWGGLSASLSGGFDLAGQASQQILFQGTNHLTVTLSLDLTNGTDLMTGQVAGPNWTAPLLAYRPPVFVGTNRSSYAGRYTVTIPGATNSPGPAGSGVGSVLVTPTGVMTFSGLLADGTPAIQVAPVSKEGLWPLYVPLYLAKGSVQSWLMFTNDPSASLTGRLTWIKPSVSTDRLYPGGFTNTATVNGSSYSIQTITNFLATNTNACMSVSGLVSEVQTNCLTLHTKTSFAGPGIRALTLDLTTGLWTGTYTNPVTSKPLPSKFTLCLQSGSGSGYVLETNRSASLDWLR